MCLFICQCLQQVNMMSISLANVKSLPVPGWEKEFISSNIHSVLQYILQSGKNNLGCLTN